MIDRSKAQIFPQPYPSASCDSYLCRQRSKWFIGRPDAPLAICLKLCDDCLKNVIESLPEGFKPTGIPEGMVMVDEATYKEMEQAAAAIKLLQDAAEQARGVYEEEQFVGTEEEAGELMAEIAGVSPMAKGTVADNAMVEAPKVDPKVGAKKA